MWYALLGALGKIVRLAPSALASALRQAGGRRQSGGARRSGGSGLLDQVSELPKSRLSGAALAAALETGRGLLSRPGVRVSVEGAVLKMLGLAEEPHRPVEPVQEAARTILRILQERGVASRRIGVDGVPGSGKSTLARALADRLGFDWKSLDHEDMNVPRDFSRERIVYEHHRLFRTQDVDSFDAIVYIDEPAEASKTRVLRRARTEGRRAVIIDVLDYDTLKEIGRRAFEVCDGDPLTIPRSPLLMKIRPRQGFRAVESIASKVQAAGHNSEGMSKEEMLFFLFDGRARSGLRAYVLPGAYNEELLQGLLAGARRYLGG